MTQLRRTGPELPGRTTVDWTLYRVGWLIPAGSRCAGCGRGDREHAVEVGTEILLTEAARRRRMIEFPVAVDVPEGVLVHAAVCGHPS